MLTTLISSLASQAAPAAVALLLAVPAQVRPDEAAPEGAARPGPRGPAPRAAQEGPDREAAREQLRSRFRDRLLDRIGGELDLDPDQRAYVETVLEQHRGQGDAARDELRAASRALREAERAEPYDAAAVRVAAERVAAARATHADVRAAVRGDVTGVLRPDQLERVESWKARADDVRGRAEAGERPMLERLRGRRGGPGRGEGPFGPGGAGRGKGALGPGGAGRGARGEAGAGRLGRGGPGERGARGGVGDRDRGGAGAREAAPEAEPRSVFDVR